MAKQFSIYFTVNLFYVDYQCIVGICYSIFIRYVSFFDTIPIKNMHFSSHSIQVNVRIMPKTDAKCAKMPKFDFFRDKYKKVF